MKRALILIVLLSFGIGSAALAQPAPKKLTVQTFKFRHKAADKAAVVIKSLISSEGSLSIQPGSNTLVVTDYADNLRNVSAAIDRYDAPPQPFTVEVRLVSAGRVTGTPPPVSPELKEISQKLSGVLRFNSFEKVGDLAIDGREGDPVNAEMKPNYRTEFVFGEYDPVSDSIRVNDFKLSRLQSVGGQQQISDLLKTSLNLTVGQTVVLGASKLPESNRALMLVIVARKR